MTMTSILLIACAAILVRAIVLDVKARRGAVVEPEPAPEPEIRVW